MGTNTFPGYDERYVKSLLEIINEDTQDNNLVEDGDYLSLAIKAAEQFNDEFEGTFD